MFCICLVCLVLFTWPCTSNRMILSQQAVFNFVESGLNCPEASYPDDMYLGYVAKMLGWDVLHSPLFHQV